MSSTTPHPELPDEPAPEPSREDPSPTIDDDKEGYASGVSEDE